MGALHAASKGISAHLPLYFQQMRKTCSHSPTVSERLLKWEILPVVSQRRTQQATWHHLTKMHRLPQNRTIQSVLAPLAKLKRFTLTFVVVLWGFHLGLYQVLLLFVFWCVFSHFKRKIAACNMFQASLFQFKNLHYLYII